MNCSECGNVGWVMIGIIEANNGGLHHERVRCGLCQGESAKVMVPACERTRRLDAMVAAIVRAGYAPQCSPSIVGHAEKLIRAIDAEVAKGDAK